MQKLKNLVYFPDIMPTFAALAGGEKALPQGINGINILPLFYGGKVDTDNRLLYWEFTESSARHDVATGNALR